MSVADLREREWAERDPWDLTVSDRAPARWRAAAGWLSQRHSLAVELVVVIVLYLVYDTSRGVVATSAGVAVAHADFINTVEHALHIDFEHTFQRVAGAVPGLLWAFGAGYASLHLVATGAALLWLHRTDAVAYVRLRLAVLAGSVLALVGFVVWPTAPPRLAGIGIVGTLATTGINLESHTLELLYNPYAAFPSLHEAYAVLTGYALWRWCRWRPLRALGVLYPAWVAAEVIATGNHFVLDVASGVAVAALGLVIARWVMHVGAETSEDGVLAEVATV